MKKFLLFSLSILLFFGVASPTSASAATEGGHFNLTALDASFEGNTLTLNTVISNVGNGTLKNVSYMELTVYDRNENVVAETNLTDDPTLTELTLEPGESTFWDLEISDVEPADVSDFSVEYYSEFLSGIAQFTSGIKIVVDNNVLPGSSKAIIQNGTTLVPMREIFESIGAEVKWNNTTKTVTATKGNDTLVLIVGAQYLTLNGQKVPLSVPAKLVNNSTLVPLRVVSESLDAIVAYGKVGKATTIAITTY